MNPIALTHKVEETYRRYLRTTFYFKDPILRTSFEDALASGRLTKGPYLEATPVFKRGATPHKTFADLLGVEPEQGFLKALQSDRPLYVHQEESIRRVANGHNVVVATGTGSGKTESFLYPILLHLYREFQADSIRPGVRALVLYPMNALANDQRDRLGEISQRLSDENSRFRFTFGQYIGETPESESDSQRHARDHMAKRLPGELVLRSEMRATPPHILLTNYSMLEYLLLRPDDSPLFDDGRAQWWTFLVLDEAHQYRGAKGIEMAMLLRRLKQRLREGGCDGPFRCLATSATLVGEQGDRASVAQFASDLFGETFRETDVVLGETETVPEFGTGRLDREAYRRLSLTLDGGPVTSLADIASTLGLQLPQAEDARKVLGYLLQHDDRTTHLRHSIIGRPGQVQAIADEVFAELPVRERLDALSELVALVLRAKDPESNAPLLSARYHLFLRSLEGAFLSLWPDRKVVLDRSAEEDSVLFEIGLCRECGQHYLVGKVNNGRLSEAVRDPGRTDFGATFFLPVADEASAKDDSDDNDARTYRLCVRCGEICRSGEGLQCSHNANILVQEQEGAEEREDQVPRCPVCGYQAPDPVREVVHGTDGPHAVIATTLFQSLPQKRRKILAFADGRQEAAFFAWYLEDSYKDILGRNLLLKTVQRQAAHTQEGSSLQDLATGLRTVFRESEMFLRATSDLQLRREGWLAPYREFLTDEPRISLDGVGLTRWSVKWPEWFRVPAVLMEEPWSLSEQEARDVVSVLMDSMRHDRAVELHSDDSTTLNWSDLGLQAAQMRFRIGAPASQKVVRSWDGVSGRRVRFLAKLLDRIRPSLTEQERLDLAVRAARGVWESLQQCDENAPTNRDRLLSPAEDARRLNPDWWRLLSIGEDSHLSRCGTCGRIQGVSIRGVCVRHRCPGSVEPMRVAELDGNHYRLLYEAALPCSLRVEEHTAQLDKETARKFQREFRESKIHVLSCSTTFELGVDLGDLDTVFLRNVPPEAFNYAQRVGRSGRRGDHPGVAVTYCRRVPHDLYHFAEPQRMLTGRVRPPVVALCNDKIITRHMAAVALSFFFRAFRERFPKVENLFTDLHSPRGLADFSAYLLSHRPQIEKTIRHIVPREMTARLGLSDGSWIDRIAGENSRMAQAEAEVSSDFKTVVSLEERSRNSRDYRTAEWAQRRADTIAKEEVLSFLSRKAEVVKPNETVPFAN